MNQLSKTFLLLLLTTIAFSQLEAQQSSIGGGAIYNFQTKSFGLDVRAEYPIEQFNILNGIIISPQLAYYPWFNNVHEFYLGASAHVGIYSYKNWTLYGLTNVSYNGWINHSESGAENAKFSNIGFDLGAGITNNSCIRPFIEYRYNFKWREANLRLGVIYTINCNKRGMVPCPKIPDSPKL